MSENVLAVVGWTVWLTLAAGAFLGIRRYARTRNTTRGFWQFSLFQYLMLVTVWTLLVWMLYVWAADYFFG